MSPASTLLTLAAVHLIAMASPGPNVLLVAQTAMSRSRAAALAVAAGVASGTAVLGTIAALGLGVVLQHVTSLHDGVRIVGGCYLVFLGLQTWRHAREPLIASTAIDGHSPWRDYRRGLLTNLTNPKAAVFFGSIMATVLRPGLPAWVNFAAVALIVFNATWWHSLLAVVFAPPRVRRGYARAKHVVDRVVGAALAGLGARLAIAR